MPKFTKQLFWGIKNPKWWSQETNACFQLCYPWMTGFANVGKYFGKDYEVVVVFFKENYGWHFLDVDRSNALARHVITRYLEDENFLNKILKKWGISRRRLLGAYKTMDRANLSGLDNRQLAALYKRVMGYYIDEFMPAMVLEAFEPYTTDIFYPQLEKYPEAERHQLNILTQPDFISFITEHQIDLLRLAMTAGRSSSLKSAVLSGKLRDIKKEFNSFYLTLLRHEKKYFWLKNNYFYVKYLDAEYFFSLIRKEVKNGTVEQIEEEIKKLEKSIVKINRQKIIKALGLPADMRAVFKLMAVFGHWQDERKRLVLISGHYIMELLKIISKRLTLNFSLVLYLHPKELLNWLVGEEKVPQDILKQRKSFSVWIGKREKEYWLVGDKAKEVAKVVFPGKEAEMRVIKGIAASPGLARGIARVVLDVNKDDFKPGEILITPMTRPEFVPLMKKAKAVVTNEGGLTCHAVIISREFGIPCVVGTKIATKVIKSGDQVEVRAHRGEIKIL